MLEDSRLSTSAPPVVRGVLPQYFFGFLFALLAAPIACGGGDNVPGNGPGTGTSGGASPGIEPQDDGPCQIDSVQLGGYRRDLLFGQELVVGSQTELSVEVAHSGDCSATLASLDADVVATVSGQEILAERVAFNGKSTASFVLPAIADCGDLDVTVSVPSGESEATDTVTLAVGRIRGSVRLPALPKAAAFGNGIGYVAHGTPADGYGLSVLDTSAISDLRILQSIDTEPISDLMLHGNVLYAASNGFRVYDVSDPANPTHITTVLEGWGPMLLQGDYLYWGSNANEGSFSVFSLADPSAPVPVTTLSSSEVGAACGMALVGDRLYLTQASPNRLYVIDISSPTEPQVLSYVELGSAGPHDVEVSGNYAFIGARYETVVVDISDSSAPEVMQRYSPLTASNGIYELEFHRDRLFYYDSDFGLGNWNVSDIENPSRDGTFCMNVQATAEAIHFENDTAFIAATGATTDIQHLFAVDVSNVGSSE